MEFYAHVVKKKEGKEKKTTETTNALSGTRSQRREVWRWLVVVAVEKVMHAGVSLVYYVCKCVSPRHVCPPHLAPASE